MTATVAGDKKSQSRLLLLYAAHISVAGYVYHVIAGKAFSSVLTLSSIFKCLAFSLLGTQISISGSVDGISAKSLFLDVFALGTRLIATVREDGYLPSDKSGDWIYQAFDGMSLAMVLWMLYRVCIDQRTTYEADEDAFPAMPLALGSLVLAAVFRGNLDQSPFYDTMWMCSVIASAITILPQMWMMTHRRGNSAALTSHFVATMVLAHVLSGAYIWHAYPAIEADKRFGSVKYAGYVVIISHTVHLLLLGDFALYFIKKKLGLESRP